MACEINIAVLDQQCVTKPNNATIPKVRKCTYSTRHMQCHLQTYGTCKPDEVAIALCFLKIGGVSVNHGGGPQNDMDVL